MGNGIGVLGMLFVLQHHYNLGAVLSRQVIHDESTLGILR